MNKTIQLSWNAIIGGCEQVAEQIKSQNYLFSDTTLSTTEGSHTHVFKSRPSFHTIIGIARGGLVPAALISQILRIPMEVGYYSSKVGRGNDKKQINQLPSYLYQPKILVVDDICDSGHTLKEIEEHYAKEGITIYTAVLHYKEGAVHTPTFYWTKLEEDAPWIDYPWESEQ